MRPWPTWPAHAIRRLQPVLAGQAQDPALRGPNALEAEARPNLAVAFAPPHAARGVGAPGMERGLGEERPDGLDQLGIGHRSDRARPLPRPLCLGLPPAIERGPGHAPDTADASEVVDPVDGGRDGTAHRRGPHAISIAWGGGLDLRRAKGRPPSSRSIFASSSSVAIVRSPTLPFSRAISASRSSASPVFSDVSPAARKASRQALSSAAVTLSSRDPRGPHDASVVGWDELDRLAPQQPQHGTLLALRRHPRPRG